MQKAMIFLSHAAADAEVARRLKHWLENATSSAITFFLSCDRESLPPGDLWYETISKALNESDIMFVLVSHHTERSQWVLFEAGYASGSGKPVIPILLPGYPRERLRPPLQFRQCIAIEDANSLGDILRRLNKLVPASFPVDPTEKELSYIFGKNVFSVREQPAMEAFPLASRQDIYEEIVKLVRMSGRHVHIRATSTLGDRDPDSDSIFNTYVEAVAEKCGEAARRGDAADYTLVMSFPVGDSGVPPEDRKQSLINRRNAFERANAADRITLLHTYEHWRMDILLIGEEHVIIGFPSRANDPRLRHGIRISGREFVAYISQWFELCVRPDANPIDLETLRVLFRSQASGMSREERTPNLAAPADPKISAG